MASFSTMKSSKKVSFVIDAPAAIFLRLVVLIRTLVVLAVFQFLLEPRTEGRHGLCVRRRTDVLPGWMAAQAHRCEGEGLLDLSLPLATVIAEVLFRASSGQNWLADRAH